MTKEYGNFEVEGALDIRNAKVKVTLYLDGSVLEASKKQASLSNMKYQVLINQLLRKSLLQESTVEERLKRLEDKITQMDSVSG